MGKIFFFIAIFSGAYFGWWIVSDEPALGFFPSLISIFLCALITGCIAASILEDSPVPDNKPSLFRRLAPFALLYWIMKDRNKD